MQKTFISRYWLFQLVGWIFFAGVNIFLALFFNSYNERGLQRVLFFIETGIIFSHLMREVIRSTDLLMKSLKQQISIFLVLIILFALMAAGSNTPFEFFFELRRNKAGTNYLYQELFYANLVSYLAIFIIWSFIYFMYHFIEKSRKQQLDTLQLEALVKSLELKTIKAHINPHFIFNSLNSIRALVDENPPRARSSITKLSNILRSSLTIEKNETVPFENELKIVKDYLELESMRFEDRLMVVYEIDADTLSLPVPPMMLQTLVENAVKHGINKEVKGGVVKIISAYTNNFHELVVQNTGFLNGQSYTEGFGISSTKDRLGLLYGEKARFNIRQAKTDLVEARVLIPITVN